MGFSCNRNLYYTYRLRSHESLVFLFGYPFSEFLLAALFGLAPAAGRLAACCACFVHIDFGRRLGVDRFVLLTYRYVDHVRRKCAVFEAFELGLACQWVYRMHFLYAVT